MSGRLLPQAERFGEASWRSSECLTCYSIVPAAVEYEISWKSMTSDDACIQCTLGERKAPRKCAGP